MATTEESPIFVQSEDESDDGDDVIVIKEEPPVVDNDVIFVSATLAINKLTDTPSKAEPSDCVQTVLCDSTCNIDDDDDDNDSTSTPSVSVSKQNVDLETNLEDVFGNGIDQLLRAAGYTSSPPGTDHLNKAPDSQGVTDSSNASAAGTSQDHVSTVTADAQMDLDANKDENDRSVEHQANSSTNLANQTLDATVNTSAQADANSLSVNGATTDLFPNQTYVTTMRSCTLNNNNDVLVDSLLITSNSAATQPSSTLHTDTKDEAFQQIEQYVRLLAETDNQDPKLCTSANPLRTHETPKTGPTLGISTNYANIPNQTPLNYNSDLKCSRIGPDNQFNSNMCMQTSTSSANLLNQVQVTPNNVLKSADQSGASCSSTTNTAASACNTNQGTVSNNDDRFLSSLFDMYLPNSNSTSTPKPSLSRTTDLSQDNLPPRKRYKYTINMSQSIDYGSSVPMETNILTNKSNQSEIICVKCTKTSLIKVSCCSNGHVFCEVCIQEHTKQVLLEKTFKYLFCLEESCRGVYSIDELKKTLPEMVVDILEKREAEKCDDNTEDRQKDDHQDIPPEWSPIDERSTLKIVVLDNDSIEFITVAIRFYKTMNGVRFCLHRISRVQNLTLWKYYNLKRIEMIHENDGLNVQEETLFHGTQGQCVEAITKKGFDWRLCGKHGSLYGEGSYFAKNAIYSHDYTDFHNFKQVRHHRKKFQAIRQKLNLFHPPPAHQSLVSIPYTPNFNPPPPAHQLLFGSTNNSQGSFISVVNSVPVPNPTYLGASTSSAFNMFSSAPNSLYSLSNRNIPVNLNPQHSTYPINNPLLGFNDLNTPVINPHMPTRGNSVPNVTIEAASESSTEAKEPEYLLKMFLSRVLVGKSTGGQKGYRKPPPLYPETDKMGRCYDSCVDNIFDPKIWVVFDSHQSYPEYLIEYTCCDLTD
ncbi:uncharacterized protein LOC126824438 [Patella vulgata]|uniref:uncharacterized protein LOC126824438 n=1 Tax=Patella vulgata TaxID=6465 RepID=UPI00217FBCE8|nr:uncharacterized protein LOC126824438 [Patella vulgata]